GRQTMPVQNPPFKPAVLTALQPLQADARVKSIETPFNVTAEQARAMTSTDGHHVYALVTLNDDYPTARQYYTQLRAKGHSDQLQVLATGNVALAADFDN